MKVPVGLETHPELWRCLQEAREPERGISRDATLAQHDLVHPVERDLEPACGLHLAQLERLQKLLEQDFAWGDRRPEPVRIPSDSLRPQLRRYARSPIET